MLLLEYECYETMAVKKMKEIGYQAIEKWGGIHKISLIHRLGKGIFTLYFILFHCISLCISYHIISSHLISSHLISSHLISYHIISYHIISYHLISFHIISHHFIKSHPILLNFTPSTNFFSFSPGQRSQHLYCRFFSSSTRVFGGSSLAH